MLKVIRRDCTEDIFQKDKISQAILKAMKNGSGIVKPKIAEDIANEIYEENADKEEISISEIEQLVFNKLISKKQRLTAKAYEGYRSIREFQRENSNTTDEQISELLRGTSEYWNEENSNKNPRLLTTQRDYMGGIVSTDITRRFLLPPKIVQAHDEGIMHFHDADYFGQDAMHNCCLINLEDMLQNGTVINGVMIEKPHRFITAMTIATQIITAVTSSQYGGATINLAHLAPFIRDSYNYQYSRLQKKFGKQLYKKYIDEWESKFSEHGEQVRDLFRNFLTYQMNDMAKEEAMELLHKEISDGVQTFNYQCNSMTTTNGQSPFLSVFMYLGDTNTYKDELAMLIEEFLNQRILGMKNEVGVYVTQAFPKLLYVLEEDNVREGSKYWELTKTCCEVYAKRLVPDYISEKKMKELKEDKVFGCMGCRSFLSVWRNDKNKFWGRFNQGVVTLNLVDVALSSEGNIEKFWELMEQRTELCHEALQYRHNRLEGTVSDVAPILWQHGALARLKKGEVIDKLLHTGYSTISLGYAGLYECVKYMTGCSHTDNGVGKKFALDVMKFMNNKCDEWNEVEDIGYSIYGSPIESTTYKFAKCLKNRFGIVEGITDKNYITNSYHVHVTEPIDAFTKLSLESEYQALSTGGSISYVEVPNMQSNLDAVLTLMQYIYDNIMYAELNTKSDYCQVCGYDGEMMIKENGSSDKLFWECPQCGNTDTNKMNVTRRTCGYIGTNFWNQGRTQEINERVLHL